MVTTSLSSAEHIRANGILLAMEATGRVSGAQVEWLTNYIDTLRDATDRK